MNQAKKKILVVDDDPDIIVQLKALLDQEYVVETAPPGAEAEEILMGSRPDLAIIDLMMETRDSGFMLCHNIKRLYPGTPVMMLTGVKATTGMSFTAGPGEEDSWFEANLLLDKPVRPDQLRRDVRRLLSKDPQAKKEGAHKKG